MYALIVGVTMMIGTLLTIGSYAMLHQQQKEQEEQPTIRAPMEKPGHIYEVQRDLKVTVKKNLYVDIRRWETAFKPSHDGVRFNKKDWLRFRTFAPSLENYMGLYHVNDKLFVEVGDVKNITLRNGKDSLTLTPKEWLKFRVKMPLISTMLENETGVVNKL